MASLVPGWTQEGGAPTVSFNMSDADIEAFMRPPPAERHRRALLRSR